MHGCHKSTLIPYKKQSCEHYGLTRSSLLRILSTSRLMFTENAAVLSSLPLGCCSVRVLTERSTAERRAVNTSSYAKPQALTLSVSATQNMSSQSGCGATQRCNTEKPKVPGQMRKLYVCGMLNSNKTPSLST